MLDKNKVQFFGDDLKGIYGPRCQCNKDHPIVGSYSCANCKYCYKIKKRVWDVRDENSWAIWRNAEYDGVVYCGSNDSNFLYKIKSRIFRLCKKKLYVKKIGTSWKSI